MYEVHLNEITGLLAKNWKRLIVYGLTGLILVSINSVFLVPRQWQASTTVVMNNIGSTSSGLSSVLSSVAGGALASLVPQQGITTDLFQTILEAWDTRTKVVGWNNLQQFFNDGHWQKSVQRLAGYAKVNTNPPTSLSLTVTFQGTPRGAALSTEGADMNVRQLVVSCSNSYLKCLSDALESVRVSSAKAQREFLEKEWPKAKRDLDNSQAALVKWEAAHHLISPPKAAEALTQKLMDIQTDLTTAQIAEKAQAAAGASAKALLVDQPEMVLAASSQAANPEILRLTQSLAMLEQQIAEQETFYHKTPQHPDVQRLLVQKQELTGQLAAAYKRGMMPATLAQARNQVRDQVLGQLLLAQVQEATQAATARGLSNVLAEAKHMVDGLTWDSLEYAKLYEDTQITKAIYETMIKQYEAAVVNEKAEAPLFYVLDPPVMPWKKCGPSYGLNAALGLLLGLFIGAICVLKKRPE